MEKITDCTGDPIYLDLTHSNEKIELRIGGFGQGEGRIAFLTPKEAISVASKLLTYVGKLLDG